MCYTSLIIKKRDKEGGEVVKSVNIAVDGEYAEESAQEMIEDLREVLRNWELPWKSQRDFMIQSI